MDLGKVEKLMQLMRTYGLHEIELKDGKDAIKLVQSAGPSFVPASVPASVPANYYPPQPVPPLAPVTPLAPLQPEASRSQAGAVPAHQAHLIEVRSPFVGTFYSSPAPGADEFVQVGQKVKKGDPLCIVEAMKLMNEIEAERPGIIVEMRVKNEQPVEFDQVLFLMEPVK